MDKKDELRLEDILYMVFSAGYDAGRDEDTDLVTAFDAYLEKLSRNEKRSNNDDQTS